MSPALSVVVPVKDEEGNAAALARAKGYPVAELNFNDFDSEGWGRRYDLLFCHQVIEHLRSPRKALARMRASPSGRCSCGNRRTCLPRGGQGPAPTATRM